jgi:hypothetical protein
LYSNHLKSIEHTHAICLARKRYNDAILHRNVDAICTFFASDYFIMTAQGVQSRGIPEQRQRWSASFQSDPIVCYRRRTRDLRISKQQLEDILQVPITSMSYPYGHMNESVREAVQRVGFTVAACSKWGVNNECSDALLLNRLDMWAGDNSRTIENNVLGYWNFLGRHT